MRTRSPLRHRPALAGLLAAVVAATGCTPPGPPSRSGSGLVRVPVQVPMSLARAPFAVPRLLNLPPGWTASVYARVDHARFLSPTPDGAILVSQPGAGTVLLVRRQADGTGAVSQFITGLNGPHDIVIAEVSGRTWVFISQADRVVRYPYATGDSHARAGEVVVDGLPDASTPELRGQYAHVLKNIAVHDGTLYVSIASTCNACAEDTRSDPQRAAIYRYDAGGTNAGRRLVARGLRNAEGLAFVPGTDQLWAVVNNRDNTRVPDDRDVDGDGTGDRGKLMPEFVDDYPVEPFVQVRDGAFFGWPFCNPAADPSRRNLGFDRDYDLNADGTAADCGRATRIDVGLPAHTAPLGLTFTQGTAAPDLGAVVALHGSWNRTTPVGYQLVHFPWSAGGPGEQRDLATGWLDPVTHQPWGRPVDVAVDTDGSLLVSDDLAGALMRLTPPRR